MLSVRIVKQRRSLVVSVEFELRPGEALGLFGASGSGKSTVLSCIAGLETPGEGEIRLGKLNLFPPALPLHLRPIGYLTQEPSLFPHLTVERNVLFGISASARRNGHGNGPAAAQWIGQLREKLQLASVWHAPAGRISGGQARRVSLARTLARRPRLLLLDEPFAGLDRQLVRELIEDLVFWNQQLGFSMIAVDHQAEVLERLCPRQVLVLERGKMVQRGSWEELRQAPASENLRSLLQPL